VPSPGHTAQPRETGSQEEEGGRFRDRVGLEAINRHEASDIIEQLNGDTGTKTMPLQYAIGSTVQERLGIDHIIPETSKLRIYKETIDRALAGAVSRASSPIKSS